MVPDAPRGLQSDTSEAHQSALGPYCCITVSCCSQTSSEIWTHSALLVISRYGATRGFSITACIVQTAFQRGAGAPFLRATYGPVSRKDVPFSKKGRSLSLLDWQSLLKLSSPSFAKRPLAFS